MLKKEINMVKKMRFDNIFDAHRFMKKLRTVNTRVSIQEKSVSQSNKVTTPRGIKQDLI